MSRRWLRWGVLVLCGVCATVAWAAAGGDDRSEPSQDPSRDGFDGAGNVVLLHGLARGARNMWVLEWRLESRGHRVCNIGYDTRVERIDEAIDEVHDGILDCGFQGGPVHFVTHSLGGLVLRGLLGRQHLIPELGRAVMLAPPNQGSEIADRLRGLGQMGVLMGPLSTQLGTRKEDLPRSLPIPTIPVGIIAGSRWINPVGPFFLPSPHDGTVSVASTHLSGMRDHIVLPYTHSFIMNATPVAHQVDTFLRSEQFDHSY